MVVLVVRQGFMFTQARKFVCPSLDWPSVSAVGPGGRGTTDYAAWVVAACSSLF